MEILSRKALLKRLRSEPGVHDCVIILEPSYDSTSTHEVFDIPTKQDLKDFENLPRRKIIKKFWDIIDPGCLDSPTEKDVKEILDWAKDKDPLVSCRMGISRSSAIALLIAAQKTAHNESAWCSIEKAIFETLNVDLHDPNTLVLNLGQKIIGRNDIVDKVSDYIKGTLYETTRDLRRFH